MGHGTGARIRQTDSSSEHCKIRRCQNSNNEEVTLQAPRATGMRQRDHFATMDTSNMHHPPHELVSIAMSVRVMPGIERLTREQACGCHPRIAKHALRRG